MKRLSIETTSRLEEILLNQEEVFQAKVGKLTSHQITLMAKSDESCVHKANTVPFALKEKVNQNLDNLLKQAIIESVRSSKYICPLVVVNNPDGSVRLYGNYKITSNKVILTDHYPLPTLDEMLQNPQGGQKFTKPDLSNAYLQLEL